MFRAASQFLQLDDLRKYVNETICEFGQLETGAFPVQEWILLRGGRPCGIFFCLYGPGSQRYTAIWETERNTVLFYGCDGQRYLKTQLTTALHVAPLAA
jgi:hypothetical protein